MKLSAVQKLLKAKILTGEELLDQIEVKMICGSDLISDVLTFTKAKSLLLTGLTNPQIIRTAEMIDLCGIVFVRGKPPAPMLFPWRRSGLFLYSLPIFPFTSLAVFYILPVSKVVADCKTTTGGEKIGGNPGPFRVPGGRG